MTNNNLIGQDTPEMSPNDILSIGRIFTSLEVFTGRQPSAVADSQMDTSATP